MKRKVIGKGLNALFSDMNTPAEAGDKGVSEIDVEKIIPNRYQPRKAFSDATLKELSSSIRQSGILQPLIVRKSGERFELIAGERRFQAAKLVGLRKIPVIVRELDESDVLLVALVENLQREDLNPVEEAEALGRLSKDFRLTHKQISERVGKSRAHVTNLLRILRLPDVVREWVRQGQLSFGHAKVLASLSDVGMQEELGRRIVERGLSVRELERLVSQPESPRERASTSTKVLRDKFLSEIQKNLRTVLDTSVAIKPRGKNGKGKIEIHYHNADDLERILKRMLGT